MAEVRRNVAIIGAGIGAEHAAAYQALPENFCVHTLCDIDTGRASQLARCVADAVVCAEFETVLGNSEIDIIDVCLPPHLHFDACEQALQSGKHVICEKPLVSSLAEVDQLIQLAEKSAGKVFPVFQYRYGPGASRLQALLDAELAGTPLVATLETHWDRDAIYYEPQWRGTWQGEQGGAVLTHAIHIHDWLCQVFGPVKSVFAQTATRVNDIEVEDCAALSIQMQNGALVTSSITLGAAGDMSRLRFCFSELTAESGLSPYAPAMDDWCFSARDPQQQAEIDQVVNAALDSSDSTLLGYEGFFKAIANELDGGAVGAVNLQDARASLEFVAATYASMRAQKPVSLPITNDHPLYKSWMPTITAPTIT